MTLKTRSRLAEQVLAFSLLALAGSAHATDINHFQAPAGPHNYIVTNHPAVLPHLKPSGWLFGNYAHDPLVCRDAQGREVHKVVEHQANMELAASIGLFDWVELGAMIPGTYLNGPSFAGVAGACQGFDPNGLNTANISDPRVQAKVMLTPWREGVVASARLALKVPLAQLHPSAGQFTGETWPNLTPAITVGYSSPNFRVGFDLGYLLRAPSTIGDLKVGHEITYGLGAEIAVLPKMVYVTGDIYGSAAPSFGSGAEFAFSNRAQFPVEIAAGVKAFLGPIAFIVGTGTGMVPDYGSPDVRIFAGIGYYPPEEEKPAEPGEVGDRDGDGLKDDVDQCPDAPEDRDGFEDEDGCPDVDNDQDGILDRHDECPLDPEDIDRWKDSDGCPDLDNDEDTIFDTEDECPNDPEVFNDFEDEDGCPDSRPDDKKKVVVVVKRQKIEIMEKVYFAFDGDRILPRSYPLLDNVAEVINNHEEIPLIVVEGHTDSVGDDGYNLDLSARRARSVATYLIAAGVDPTRLKSRGYGEEQPIDSNDTEDGRARNRRVEFKIVEGEVGEGGKSTDEGGE